MEKIVIFFGIYVVFHIAMNAVAQRYRKRLMALIKELKKQNLQDVEIELLDSFANTAYSIRSAPSILFVFLAGLMKGGDQIRREAEAFDRTAEYSTLLQSELMHELLDCHMASTAAANPIFGSLAYTARLFYRIKVRRLVAEQNSDSSIDMMELRAAV